MKHFPESVEEIYALSNKRRKAFERIMRTRYLDPATGKMLELGKNKPGDPFWAEVYDGRFGHVVFGHEPLYGVTFFPYATGIDTSAVYGGLLTALVYEDESYESKGRAGARLEVVCSAARRARSRVMRLRWVAALGWSLGLWYGGRAVSAGC